MNRYCYPPCHICRSGRKCAAQARAEAEEIAEEESAAAADEARERAYERRKTLPRPDASWYDRADPWPATRSGVLRDDPALERG